MSQKTNTYRQSALPKKTFSKYRTPMVTVPNLIENQLQSYRKFLEEDLQRIIKEYSPVSDYSEKKFEFTITGLRLISPDHDENFAKENKFTFEGQLKAQVKIHNKVLGGVKDQEISLTEIPLMTPNGTFIINGVERVIVPQLMRSPGVSFTETLTKKGRFFGAKIIPSRGAWIEIESDADNAVFVRIDKKRKFYVTTLLRVLGAESDESILELFTNETAKNYIAYSLSKDTTKTPTEAYVDIYKKLRDGESAPADSAREFFQSIFSVERYDLSRVGRYFFNKRFDKSLSDEAIAMQQLSVEDIVTIIEHIATLNTTPRSKADDIDHLGSRRVRFVGELVELAVRKGMARMKRNIQDKMSTIDTNTMLPIQFINQRPLQAAIREFFTQNQLSQFISQENLLTEVDHLRRVSALGPGGLTRERAGFEVRDLHPSHYGRLCPIRTPEGPNIGLILQLSMYARINEFGMIETPYMKVKNAKVTNEIIYMNALEEEKYIIAHAGMVTEKGVIEREIVEARVHGAPGYATKDKIDFIDVAINQAFSVAASLIPFLEHDDAKRTLMGSNMQTQAMPCVVPMAPLVATGIEDRAALDTGRLCIADEDGTVVAVDGQKIDIKNSKGKVVSYPLTVYTRTNQSTIYHQRPIVDLGQKVVMGQVLADGATTENGQLAIGQNIRVAFMCWNGANFEDAIIVSERLVKKSVFTSIHIEEYACIVRDTKLGEEQTTHDIPNVGESKLKDLDEEGIVRIGAEVHEHDILVGKITPKGEVELTPEERLLRSIFGEKVRDVKDTSLRMEKGAKGRVIGVKVFSRENGHDLESGVLKKIYIQIAQLRNIQMGDKLAGRHGNKGVVSVVLPEEDMPYTADGKPIDIVLTPLGVPSRMNLGQILEMHLGLSAHALNYQAIVPPFSGASPEEVKEELVKSGYAETGKVTLYDGRTGDQFDQDIAIGYMYMLKLSHMVEDKIHARSVGPYSLITQQPLGGKAQGGGQRFGEMEVWALEGYGAAHTLREMLTVKSDDILGRTQAFDAIIKGETIAKPNVPASFQVMLHYLKGLALDISIRASDTGKEKGVASGPVNKVEMNFELDELISDEDL
jgi:DNA-directed RNA polymerase subunit beta